MIKFDTLKKSSLARASLVVVSLVALGSISTSLSASPEDRGDHCERGRFEGHHRHPGGIAPLPHLLHQLGLSDAQKDKAFNITYAQMPQMRENHMQHEKLIEELIVTSQAEQFDDKKAQAIADKLAAVEKQIALAHARTDAKLYALLTPEQKDKLKDIIENAKLKQADEGFPPDDAPVSFKRGHRGDHTPKLM